MLKLEFNLDNSDDARLYINAPQMYSMITDFANALKAARKHGNSEDLAKVVDDFWPDLLATIDSVEGPY